jgi:hypothetical protein
MNETRCTISHMRCARASLNRPGREWLTPISHLFLSNALYFVHVFLFYFCSTSLSIDDRAQMFLRALVSARAANADRVTLDELQVR